MKPQYANRNGGPTINGLPAQIVGSALDEIRRKNGGELRPEDVVREASNPNHVLHRMFTWDDSRAAHAYRLWEARQLIRSVTVIIQHGDRRIIAPSYISVPASARDGSDRSSEDDGDDDEPPSRHYQSVVVAVRSQEQWDAALADFRRKADSILATISQLNVLAETLGRDTAALRRVEAYFRRAAEAARAL